MYKRQEYTVEQLEKQLNKVIPVIKVKTLREGDYIPRTLSLIKVSVSAGHRAEIMRITELMGARIVDATRTTLTVEFSDTAERTEILDVYKRQVYSCVVRHPWCRAGYLK